MIELIPFLLFLMEWHADRPDDMLLTRHPDVYVDEAACLEAGAQLVAEAALVQEVGQEDLARASFSCQPMPPREEFNAMLEREFGETGE